MTVTVYTSYDAGAPILTGLAGSMIPVLDACLVTGYGVKVGAGWTKAFSSTNRADYRQGSGSLQHYLDVNDNAPVYSVETRILGYEVMTALGVGLYPYPLPTQVGGGFLTVRKAVAADAAPRAWIIVADQRTMYMFILTGDYTNVYQGWAFGEYYSFKTNDLGRNFIQARLEGGGGNTSSVFTGIDSMTFITTALNGMFVNRDVSGAIGSVAAGKLGDMSLTISQSSYMVGYLQFTNPADSRIYLAPLRVNTVTGSIYCIRGRLRGWWFFTHPNSSVSDRDTFIGVDDLAGKTFLIIKRTNADGVHCMEISNTWETN